jgi:hypothetical protein
MVVTKDQKLEFKGLIFSALACEFLDMDIILNEFLLVFIFIGGRFFAFSIYSQGDSLLQLLQPVEVNLLAAGAARIL